ncbi:hypothetical protein [Neptunomonas antarctica]|uniref:Uncharacterized protein n=1 Tax=Neptunomonas antarctica TaxID=619304 RepID=A0A1N7M817_9GAMM|nr:hypothetical protein [Neptunomonas antarctica]SIS82255.1 hypothetical protein SAMN05421760_105254 [Neptunomonas antarctica]
MSQLLTDILEDVRKEYLQRMDANNFSQPFLTAEKLCHEKLYLATDLLADIVNEDPTLLATRASDLIADSRERDNPAVGAIISSNIVMAALESLLGLAVANGWLDVDDDGHILVEDAELDPSRNYPVTADYSRSDAATKNLSKRGPSLLTTIFQAAENEFLELLETEVHEAYQLALQVSGNYAIFAPEDIAPLIVENPLLLGLRPDDMVDEELFEGDPPAGIIISGHLTHILLDQLLELAESKGALGKDGAGHIILPEGDGDNPIVH